LTHRLYRLILLAALLLVAVLPVHAGFVPGVIVSLTCDSTGHVVVTWLTNSNFNYNLQATESSVGYPIPDVMAGSTTTVWTNGTFHVQLRAGIVPAVEDTGVITCFAGLTAAAAAEQVANAAPPPPPRWEGFGYDLDYDGRVNATMADRYAVYCHLDELQVWDSATNSKIGFFSYSDILTLANPGLSRIGDEIWLGRSNNTLIVVGPGEFTKDEINMDKCVTDHYQGIHD
jgi:hypothetical protein